MKRILTIVGIVVAVLIVAFLVLRSFTKSASPESVTEIKTEGLTVRVDYCRPAMKGRKIFGELVPYGKVWRTGANEATVITLGQDVKTGEQTIKAGKYSLWTIPSPNGWTAIFNKQTGQWGTMYDEKEDVVRVPMQVRATAKPVEQFEIRFDSVGRPGVIGLVMAWENTEAVLLIQ
jgi:hypothetical protein